jgi:hypothetical protein
MIDHVTDLLGAYQDGELRGLRLLQVEDHLSKCAACRKELAELRSLSTLLQESLPAEDFVPAERFIPSLILRLNAADAARNLPRQSISTSHPAANPLGWLVPASALGAWVLLQAATTISTLVSAANLAGLPGDAAAWLQSGPQNTLWFSTSMSLFGGNLSGNSRTVLDVLNGVSVFGSSLVMQFFFQVLIAGALCTWLAVWWSHRKAAVLTGSPQVQPHS